MDNERNPNDSVTLFNPDTESIMGIWEKRSYGTLQPQATGQFPRFVAENVVKDLIDRILLKKDPKGNLLNNIPMRQELARQIIRHIEPVVKIEQVIPQATKRQSFDYTDFDVLNSPEFSPAPVQPVNPGNSVVVPEVNQPVVTASVPSTHNDLDGFSPVTPADYSVTPQAPAETPAHSAKPSRQDIYTHAVSIGLDVNNPDVKDKLENMSIPELVTELQYPQM